MTFMALPQTQESQRRKILVLHYQTLQLQTTITTVFFSSTRKAQGLIFKLFSYKEVIDLFVDYTTQKPLSKL